MFSLPDGSKGWLNSGSTLSFPQTFHGRTREVTLNGEAYFDVVTNPRRPFVVSEKNLKVVARGTAFNISSWEDDPGSRITLVHGKLQVYRQKVSRTSLVATLKPDQMLDYNPSDNRSTVRNVDINEYVAWKQGKLIFRDDPFPEVVKKISRWYNVNIVLKDDRLKSYTYVATFQDESLDEVLKMLRISAPIEYRNLERKQGSDGTYEKRTIEIYYNPKKK